jgi:hypothetical protein
VIVPVSVFAPDRAVLVFHISCFVSLFMCLYKLNMNRNHAALWSASPSPQENRYTVKKI